MTKASGQRQEISYCVHLLFGWHEPTDTVAYSSKLSPFRTCTANLELPRYHQEELQVRTQMFEWAGRDIKQTLPYVWIEQVIVWRIHTKWVGMLTKFLSRRTRREHTSEGEDRESFTWRWQRRYLERWTSVSNKLISVLWPNYKPAKLLRYNLCHVLPPARSAQASSLS